MSLLLLLLLVPHQYWFKFLFNCFWTKPHSSTELRMGIIWDDYSIVSFNVSERMERANGKLHSLLLALVEIGVALNIPRQPVLWNLRRVTIVAFSFRELS